MNWDYDEKAGMWCSRSKLGAFHIGHYKFLHPDKPYFLTGVIWHGGLIENTWCPTLEDAKALAMFYTVEKELDRGSN